MDKESENGTKSASAIDPSMVKILAHTAKAEARKIVPIQMSLWGDGTRAIANELARSALFRCTDTRKPREYFDNTTIFMLGEGQITYKGEELRTQDEDIFVSIAHLARDLPAEKIKIKFTSSDLCKMNGWRQDQRVYNVIYLSIQRMRAGVITIISRRLAKALRWQRAVENGASDAELAALYLELEKSEEQAHRKTKDSVAAMMLSLISGDPTAEGGGDVIHNIPQGNLKWEVELDKHIVTLFAKPYLTLIDQGIRKELSPTAKRLHAFFASHKNPYPVKLRNLGKMLGLNFKRDRDLKSNIAECLEQIKKHGGISSYDFDKTASGDDWLVKTTKD